MAKNTSLVLMRVAVVVIVRIRAADDACANWR